ncbi:GNAT family N-acetyltransferase [Lederbergia sp. NSJ-179]|uniref:GNAT family N-acetyltransferase n=1 Tax=Lederbergia sp. NSJ-179 TaxID=2931402 RepID=UPI001FD15C36|nr:GNAT family N-acetyltransferase [Lederbergia sp. NSJ-179]MCJ7841462.1 GNAT family N-acetyltransferase [Lederbergia sp. NSJ-179]
MEISGEKIWLSRVSINDLDFICRIECDENLWYFEEYVESDENVVREEYIQRMEEKEKPTSYDFIVTAAVDKKKTPIGLAQVWNDSEYRKSWEIGFAILPEYEGKGYGSEAAKLLLQFAFEKLAAHKVIGMCNSNNTRSAALMEHLGMRREAIFKEELFWQNKWVD